MELIDVEFHEQSNQIRIILYERKPFGCNKSHYTKKNWCPKLFNFVPLESDSPFKFGTLWFTNKRQWLTEFQSLLVQDYCLGTRIYWINNINAKLSILTCPTILFKVKSITGAESVSSTEKIDQKCFTMGLIL